MGTKLVLANDDLLNVCYTCDHTTLSPVLSQSLGFQPAMPHTSTKISICLFFSLTAQWTSATTTRPPEEQMNNSHLVSRSFNATAALALPPCVQTCGQQILPIYSCLPGDPSYCNRTGPVQTALSACVKSNCTSLSAKLAGAKFTADTCHYPNPDLGPTTRATADTLFSLATFFVAARMLSRWKKIGGAGFWWDDFVAGLLYLPTVGLLVVTHFTVKNGSGQDVWQLSVERITRYMEWFLVGQVMVFIVMFGAKISILLLYLRIWPLDFRRWDFFRIACKITIVVLAMALISSVLTVIFSCRPIDAYWKLWLRPTSYCIHSTDLHYSYAGINLTLDLIVLGLPVKRLTELQITVWQKIGVIATFLVGGLATLCSVMRVYYLYETFGTTNVTHDFSHAGLWGVIELNASVITCCMPPTAGLAKRLWRKMYKTCRDSILSLTSSRIDQTDDSGETHIERGDGHLPEQEKASEWFERNQVEKGASWSETMGSGSRNDSDPC
ncbi:Satratoxin biosynthesis SC1 cluster protein 4 [Pseudocercospora fuligena]|uniref:Satratoxin biosynthesis SC1 cluster protein 4 n=1 Tax=Pseudocercospora fuligena TaxID=685502 RepID=A0A8H6R8I2_9PEZI|nr:Satratoxin biosynthesis SC1 cluster protein 4 [Pseudocercospora fuligena]